MDFIFELVYHKKLFILQQGSQFINLIILEVLKVA